MKEIKQIYIKAVSLLSEDKVKYQIERLKEIIRIAQETVNELEAKQAINKGE